MPLSFHLLSLSGPRRRLAVEVRPGVTPAVVFLHGWGSDMTGDKAEHLAKECARTGRAFVRFDLTGHGRSDGERAWATLDTWLDDALAVLDRFAPGSFVLVGSSLGGWLALLAGLRRPERLAGLVTIAAAPDFTRRIRANLGEDQAAALERGEVVEVPSSWGGHPVHEGLLASGERLALLDGPIGLACPVHLLHGQRDEVVPWRAALRIANRLESRAVTVELVHDGDHRLSRPADLARLWNAVARVIEGASRR